MSVKPTKDLSKDPTMTVAMGMKQNYVSQQCWRDACRKEGDIRTEWGRTYMPELEEQKAEIAARVHARDAERLHETLSNPLRSKLFDGVSKDGGGRIAYLKARRQLTPQERFGTQPPTASMVAGWTSHQLPPPRIDGLPSYGRKPVIKNGFFRRTIGGSLAQASH